MSVNIDLHTFKNFSGSGKEQKFVSIQQGKPLTRRKIEELLQARCTITRADAEAVFTALADLAKEQLSMGNRFYIPEIGYLSLVANVDLPQNTPMEKISSSERKRNFWKKCSRKPISTGRNSPQSRWNIVRRK